MPKHPEPPQDNSDSADTPVPNRRDRRGGKSEVPSYRGGKPAGGRRQGNVSHSRQYSTRRRGG